MLYAPVTSPPAFTRSDGSSGWGLGLSQTPFSRVCALHDPGSPLGQDQALCSVVSQAVSPSFDPATDTGARVSHQAIANRLRTVDLASLQFLFHYGSEGACRLLGRGFSRRARLRLFDCTTREVPPEAGAWAATNGDKNAVRLALGLNSVTELPVAVLDASETTSDITVFPAIVAQLRPRETAVLEAGFTWLRDFIAILAKGTHFVTRMVQIYEIQIVRAFKLPGGERARFDEWSLLADERVLVGTPMNGGPLEARCVTWAKLTSKGEEVHRVIWTDRFDLTPKRLFKIDLIL